MRPLRVLKQGVWYEIRSQINNREPLFRRSQALALFDQVFREAKLRFVFRACDLRLEDDWLTFYKKPEDGMKLPAIMKWLKQTFAQRYNRLTGGIGHVWGDRYWSGILEGDPPEGASGGGGAAPTTGVRPRGWKSGGRAAVSAVSPASQAPPPG
ncbi:MAG: transposase [Spirochaetaceae bacterium]|jgi:REP element-mobilizing transposase RayT|nr:transposase [Spirochaetaceae bacterium]